MNIEKIHSFLVRLLDVHIFEIICVKGYAGIRMFPDTADTISQNLVVRSTEIRRGSRVNCVYRLTGHPYLRRLLVEHLTEIREQ